MGHLVELAVFFGQLEAVGLKGPATKFIVWVVFRLAAGGAVAALGTRSGAFGLAAVKPPASQALGRRR
jgi:hypothetical protein